MFPLPNEEYLVTARVPQLPPSFVPRLQEKYAQEKSVVTRRYKLPYFPSGLWARLITRVLLYQKEHLIETEVSISKLLILTMKKLISFSV